ncbi:lactoylglutathione lyase [Xanthomonas phaseoli]|uniref:lactoylglutathione lyase n=3 Tax=Xanthomonas TaxID=338 RepID=UPI000A6BAED7|nr:lactoylglutathione lyase [Xanthomonas phaseoli]
MLHHVSLGVRAATFYDAALGALGDVRVWSDLEPGTRDQAVGYGGPGGEGCLALERVMSVEVSAKRPVARRDKACAAARAGRLGKARNAVSARHRALPGGLAVSGTEHAPRGLPWRQPRRRHAAPAPHR